MCASVRPCVYYTEGYLGKGKKKEIKGEENGKLAELGARELLLLLPLQLILLLYIPRAVETGRDRRRRKVLHLNLELFH